MKIRKPYTTIRFISQPGSPYKNEYELDIDKKGKEILRISGKIDIQEEIQGYAEEVTIENILARVAVGDMKDFRADGIYQDISEIPNNFIEANREIMKVKNLWNRLKPSIREKYENDVNVFMAQAGQKAWLIDTGMIEADKIEAPKIRDEMKEAVKGVTDAAPAAE